MATNAAIQYILPAAQIAASETAGSRSAHSRRRAAEERGFVATAMAVSIFVTLNGTAMSGHAFRLPPPVTGSFSASSRISTPAFSPHPLR